MREKVNELSEKIKQQNANQKVWYEEYLSRTMSANKLIMEEIDRVRSRVVSAESQGLTLHEKFSNIATTSKVHSEDLTLIKN